MNLNEQLRQAYESGRRQALNELSPANPQLNPGSGFGGPGGGYEGGNRNNPGYADYLPGGNPWGGTQPPQDWGGLGWESMAEFLGMTPEEFQAMWTSVGVDPNFDWSQFGFTQGANGAWSQSMGIPGMPWASIIVSWNTTTNQWVFTSTSY